MKWILLLAMLEQGGGWSLTTHTFDGHAQCVMTGESLAKKWGDSSKHTVWSCTPQVAK